MNHTIADISRLLSQRAEDVTLMLLPGGKRMNGHWVCGDLSGDRGQSLKVELGGTHTGKWRDWAGTDKGDLLDLWSATRSVPLPEACKQARAWLGLPEVVRAQEKTWKAPTPRPLAEEHGLVRKYLRDQRKLEDRIVNRFKIEVRVDEIDGRKIGYIAFPSYSPSGDLINHCYVSLERGENGKKDVKQDFGCAPSLFGWQALDQSAYDTRTIIICEGQIDCMTWTQWGFNCLSIPNGGGNSWIEFEWENLEVFSTIYLSYDMDAKLSGVQETAITRLGKHRCRLIQLPHKDANDGLKAGMNSEEAKKCVNAAVAPKLKYFTSLTQIRERVISHFFPSDTGQKLLQPPILTGPFPEKTFTVRPGEVSLWTGIAGHGKSTLLAQLFIEMIMLSQTVHITSLEMKPERIIKKMATCVAGGSEITKDDLSNFLDMVGERICFCDKLGSITTSELFEMMEFAYCRYGATQFLIDSLMRIEGLEEDYKGQSKFMNDLCRFSGDRMVHIHLVAHPRKTLEDQKPSANDLKGSSGLRANADNVFVVHRNFAKERKYADGEITDEDFNSEWDTSVMVDKDREEGDVKVFYYKYIKKQERYTPMKSKGGPVVVKSNYKPKKRRWNDD